MNINVTQLSHLNTVSKKSSVNGGFLIDLGIDYGTNTNVKSSIKFDPGNTALSGGNGLAFGDNTFTQANFLAKTTDFSSQSTGFVTSATR